MIHNLSESVIQIQKFLQQRSSFLNDILAKNSPSRKSPTSKRDKSATPLKLTEADEIPLFWTFPELPNSNSVLHPHKDENLDRQTPELLNTSFGDQDFGLVIDSTPESGTTGQKRSKNKSKKKESSFLECTGCSPLDTQIIRKVTAQTLSSDGSQTNLGQKSAEEMKYNQSFSKRKQSKCVSFAQSAEDLYLFQLSEFEHIPDPKAHLIGFYSVRANTITPSPRKQGSPTKLNNSSAFSVGMSRPISALKRESKLPGASTRRSRGNQEGLFTTKTFLQTPSNLKMPSLLEKSGEMKSRDSIVTNSDSAKESANSVQEVIRPSKIMQSYSKVREKSAGNPRTLENTLLLRKSMVVGPIQRAVRKAEMKKEQSVTRKSQLNKTSLHARQLTGELKKEEAKGKVNSGVKEIRTNKRMSLYEKQQQWRSKKLSGIKDRKVLLHQSINNSQEIHQTIDLSQSSGINNSMLTDQEDSTPISRIDLRHASQGTTAQSSPKNVLKGFRSGFKPSAQQSRESIKEQIVEGEIVATFSLKEEVKEEPKEITKILRDSSPHMKAIIQKKSEDPEEKDHSPESRSPKKNFVKMNIDKMKQSKKSVLERKFASGKRSALRQRYTSLAPERQAALWQSDGRQEIMESRRTRHSSKGAVGESLSSTLRMSTQRKSVLHESQLSVAVKSVTMRPKEEEASGELTPIGEKRGKPTFRVAKGTGVSHFSLKQQPRSKLGLQLATSTLRNQKSVDRKESLRQSLRFPQKSLEIKDQKYQSATSCKRSSIYAKQSFLNKPSLSSTSPSETPSGKFSDLDARRKLVKNMLSSSMVDSRGKLVKRNSGIPRVTNMLQTRHSIAIPPKQFSGDITNESNFMRNDSEQESSQSAHSERMTLEETMKCHENEELLLLSTAAAQLFRRKPQVDEIKEEQRGHSSPPKCSKRRAELVSHNEEQENEEKEMEAALSKAEGRRVVLKESPQARGNTEQKNETPLMKSSLKKTPVEHSRRLSSGKTGTTHITPRPGIVKPGTMKLKTPTSLRKPGWAK